MEIPDGVKLIRLECGKANAIDGALLETLGTALDEALSEDARAVVVTGYDRFFSAGLNLKNLPDTHKGMSAFVETFDHGMRRLWSFPLPTVAAINGHAIAGGCVLAAACDVRVAADGDYRVGLSEIDLGVPFPASALEILRAAIDAAWLTELVLGGRLLGPKDAREAGLLHAVVPSESLMPESLARADRLGAKPQPAFRRTKETLRADALARIEARADEDRRHFIEAWFSDETKKRREAMLSR